MPAPEEIQAPELPFPVFRISTQVERYLLYDVKVITWLRREHHILGVLMGTLPQIPQQNVFLGLPLRLMPEEVMLLVKKNLAYIVDDFESHAQGLKAMSKEDRMVFDEGLRREGKAAWQMAMKKKMESTEKAMRKLRLSSTPLRDETPDSTTKASSENVDGEESLFAPANEDRSKSLASSRSELSGATAWSITPTTSYPMLPNSPVQSIVHVPAVIESSYALFRHMHNNGYYMSPGLRFGCQFLVYPGDPLRFHSHFLAVSADWEEELDLMDIIGGGRLGTGVKKGYLLGGIEEHSDVTKHKTDKEPKVRTFCIEWGGM
jgi:tRNA-splicing endonuclease subunit Sen34